MFPVFWKAVARLERYGIKVLGLTCDGLSANCRLFQLHKSDKDTEFTYKVSNPYSSEPRVIYFLSDSPHLLKTVTIAVKQTKTALGKLDGYASDVHTYMYNACMLLGCCYVCMYYLLVVQQANLLVPPTETVLQWKAPSRGTWTLIGS